LVVFALESTDALKAVSTWSAESAPTAVGEQNVITLETGAGPKFYRLRKP